MTAADSEEPRRRPILDSIGPLLLGAVLIAVWQFVVPFANISEIILPTPFQIAKRIVIDYRLLAGDALATLIEVVVGFAMATIVAVPIALAIFYWRFVERTLYPLLLAFQTVPKVALAPLLVLWFGFDFVPKVLIGFLTAFFPIVIATVVGLEGLDREMVRLLKSMGASEWQMFWKLRLPNALPSLFGGLKIGISLAVIGSIIGEYVASERGLGYRQLTANAQFDSSMNFAALVIISLIGIVTFYAVYLVERAFARYR